ncbi:uncharacterized protein LOC100900358 [Galendromus occidentalis]|uniref:Uncharacterized protein LOC100900358 n=1 Tax=Galendromus occidentalis TaxID=34638 RepID=A0AAJ6VZV1_9ACAR|nr:uncharacterized protein LOC100900358 [Galendromus occidentalis]
MFRKKAVADYHRPSSDEEEPMFTDRQHGVCMGSEAAAEENEQLFRKETYERDEDTFSSRASSRNSQKQTGWRDAWRKVGDKVSSYVNHAVSPAWGYGTTTATRDAVNSRMSDADQETIKAL